ncbi:MAG: PorP/SprF family type IX secretion system membrane protein [Prevotellaceae bacterium]|nr:PorP/SprF family type IX secretion system membrane protein [Prevotellaceae bacterium]
MLKVKAYICVIFLCAASSLQAQDPYLAIKPAMPLWFNPAYAGNEYYTRATLNYRNHYPASGTGFATYSASFDTYIDRYNSGLGITLMSDQLGSKSYSYSSAGLFWSYKITTGSSSYIKAGLTGNIFYGINDPNSLLFPDMINPDGTTDPNLFTYDRLSTFGADFGFGALFSSNFFETGAAIHHLGREDKNLYWSRPVRIFAHAEWYIPIFGKTRYSTRKGFTYYLKESALKPNIFVTHQAKVTLWGVGLAYQFLNFNAGVSSRQNFKLNSFTTSFHIGYFSDIMEIHYAFDLGVTGKNFRGLATSSHEIGIVFKFDTGKESE